MVVGLSQGSLTFLLSCYSFGGADGWRKQGQLSRMSGRKWRLYGFGKGTVPDCCIPWSWCTLPILPCLMSVRHFGKVPLSESVHCLHDLNIQMAPSFRLSDCLSREKPQQNGSVREVGTGRGALRPRPQRVAEVTSWLVKSHFWQ